MSFRDVEQKAGACRALLERVDLGHCWTAKGPNGHARVAPAGEQHADARRLLAACWAIWENCSTLSLNEILELEDEHLEALGELLTAVSRGSSAIDEWLRGREPVRALAVGGRRCSPISTSRLAARVAVLEAPGDGAPRDRSRRDREG